MSTLYILLICLLLIALGIITIPFKRYHAVFSKKFSLVIILISITALSLYRLIQPHELNTWLTGGKEHYQLLVEFEQLGGIKGAINSITATLTREPENIQAWTILGKLYLADHNEAAAQAAFKRAHELQQEKNK